MTNTHTKVLFELDDRDWHGHSTETVWAEVVQQNGSGLFRILNSPFFVKGIAYRDVVEAAPIKDSTVVAFTRVHERSGHSTYMVLAVPGDHRFDAYWKPLQDSGCTHESGDIRLSIGLRVLYSVDVPASADRRAAYEMLERGENDNVWRFQEGYAHVKDSQPSS